MSVAETLERKLRAALLPTSLIIIDESHRHVGHAGSRPEGETHFTIEIVSSQFEGMTRVERHRAVTTILAEELAGPVHALSLRTPTPTEAQELQP
ncbi:MAG: BolA family transcriptional regulator [Rhodospirillales bacterium]|nr:BolA family transcriptional regulator [Rhodospirillales bacterium]